MAESSKVGQGTGDGPPNPKHSGPFKDWLANQPREWSVVIAARTALRILPLLHAEPSLPSVILPVFRATAIARYAALYPRRAARFATSGIARAAAASAIKIASRSKSGAVAAAADAALAAGSLGGGEVASSPAAAVVVNGISASGMLGAQAFLDSIDQDAQQLHAGLPPERLAGMQLWPSEAKGPYWGEWQQIALALLQRGKHWSVWVKWYEDLLAGSPYREKEDVAFTDIPGLISWRNSKVVNKEIISRLSVIRNQLELPGIEEPEGSVGSAIANHIDPDPLEGIPSPIAIFCRPDGRIGADAGLFATPTLPPTIESGDHVRLLEACRARAKQLCNQAMSPRFQGRSDYAESLTQYLEWLPSQSGTGNILLADGEARVLNRLFVAEQDILSTAFASRLSTLLEDHFGLRPYYPELERHYHSIRTGHLATPLPRDAVESIRQAIHVHSPAVFDETVAPALAETARPIPVVSAPPADEVPPSDPNRPKPPRDPIADVDPAASRNFTFASAANRIYRILKNGKDAGDGVKGWNEVYAAFKEHIAPLLKWLQENWPGGGTDGGSTLPPTI